MKRKILLGLFVICLSGILVACSNNSDGENPVNNALEHAEVNNKANESSNKESKEGVNIESNKKENTDKNKNEKKENSTARNGFLFSTEYEIEDYCHGYFVASKMDKRLHGILDVKGKEVVPLKYDDISIEMVSGYEQSKETNFLAQYEGEYYFLDEKAEKADNVFVKEAYLDGEEVFYKFDGYKDNVYMNLLISDVDVNGEGGCVLGDNRVFGWEPLKSKYYLMCVNVSSGYYSDGTSFYIGGSYISDEQDYVIGRVENVFYNLIYDIKEYDGEIVAKFKDGSSYSSGGVGWKHTVFYSLNTQGEWKKISSCAEITENDMVTIETEGAWNTVDGYYEDADGNGIYKGICPENAKYVFGKNDNIFLKYSYETWKLVNADDTPVYEDRYFDMVKFGEGTYEYFFLQNSDMEACLINKDGKKIAEDGTFTWEEGKEFPDFMGGNLVDDTVFAGDDALYIVRKNGAKYDVYRFGAK